MDQASSKALVVAAIDFGTTNSGWAYSFKHEFKSEPAKASLKQWNSGSGTLTTEKTPTSALISPDGNKLVEFGYEAENKFRDLVEKDHHRDYYYFSRFKMSLNKEAGIDKDKLSIALEPEAASIFCRHLSVDHFVGGETISTLPTGTKYMVLDAGGGTTDITVHEVTSSGGLKEVHAASGGGWGAILVDEAFKRLLIDIIGEDVYAKFMKQETEDWIELWRTFEFKKKTVDPAKKDKVTMKLPSTLIEMYKKETKQDIRDKIAESEYRGKIIFAGGDKIRYEATLIQSLFKKSIDTTVSHVKSLLQDENARDVKAIVMVGGFSESPMLQDAIKKAFLRLKIIIPKEASSAILRGAVIFGHNLTSITQRVLKKTYGVRCNVTFNKDVHDEKYRVKGPEEFECEKIFDKHVEKGQSVVVGEAQAEMKYVPVQHNKKTMYFPVFASDLKDPKYTDQGCQHLGTLEVDISDVPGDLDRRVFVKLIFGDTEVKAMARIEKTGQVVSASFDFLG